MRTRRILFLLLLNLLMVRRISPPKSLKILPKIYTGHPPAVALFSTKARYKRESYRGSEFAPKILAENGLKVIMKVRSNPDLFETFTNM